MAFVKKTRKKLCKLRQSHIYHVDYKNVELLSSYINVNGKILPRRATGASASAQRQVANAIKKARFLALLPYVKN
jgi:small subunit ribosomal protein S18